MRPLVAISVALILTALTELGAATSSVSVSSGADTATQMSTQARSSSPSAAGSGGFSSSGGGKAIDAAFPNRTAAKKADFFGSGKASDAAKSADSRRSLGDLLRGRVLTEIDACVGLPYRQGGRHPGSGFDPAGFVHYLFGSVYRAVPDDLEGLQNAGTRLSADQFVERNRFRDDPPRFRIGDVLFYRVFSRKVEGPVLQPVVYCGDGRAAFPSAAEGRVVIRDLRSTATSLAFVQRLLQP